MHTLSPMTVVFLWKGYLEVRIVMATIKIKQVRSKIGAPAVQKRTLEALGLRKIGQIVEREDTPSVRGMINRVNHLVIIVE